MRIEKPFPWLAVVLIPAGWVASALRWVAESLRLGWNSMSPEEPDMTVRVYDNDFNFLWSGTKMPEHVVIDFRGARYLFRMQYNSNDQYLTKMLVWDNPFWELPDDPFDLSEWLGDCEFDDPFVKEMYQNKETCEY